MMRPFANTTILTLIATLAAAPRPAVAAEHRLCDDVVVVGPNNLSFTDSEQKLACGDPSVKAWSRVPPRQSAYFIRNFLAERGFHSPTQTIKGESLRIEAGPLTLVRQVRLEGSPLPIDVTRYWEVYGRPLAPSTLDDLGKWLKTELATGGYPCAALELGADPTTGVVTARVDGDAKLFTVPPIASQPIPGANGEIQRRYYAFREGDRYDSMQLDLSSRRMMDDELVVSAYFVTNCSRDGQSLTIEERLTPGEPRLVSAGLGFDTEEYAIGEATWKNVRLGESASRLQVAARASYRHQLATMTFDWYYAPMVARHFLRSTATYERENEKRHDTRSLSAQVGPAWTRDRGHVYYELWVGGAYRHAETVRGLAPGTARSFQTEATFNLRSHDFEYYAAAPRSGYSLTVDWQRAKKEIGADFSATRYMLASTMLWNAFDLDPPIWILGVRTKLAATVTADGTTAEDLPVTYRNFLGGSQDLRGFGRQRLPPDDLGALTSAYAGVEARINKVLPFGLQPIVFADFARQGAGNATLDPSLFWSPGIGMHWQSPIGTLRTTFAHGFVEGEQRDALAYLSQWQFYFSFGEQF